MIELRHFEPPAWNVREIMRYARIRGADDGYRELLDECMREAEPALSYRVCYSILRVEHNRDNLHFGNIVTASQTISKAIRNADEVVLFAATVGAPFDLLIRKYSALSPAKALILQAIGAERAESLCDAFCTEINSTLSENGKRLSPRVSPGYGDIPLMMQKEIFALLDCPRKIGLTLDESLLMSPSKSVTALCGVIDCDDEAEKRSCDNCMKTDCEYRI